VIGLATKVALALACAAASYFELRTPFYLPPHFWYLIGVFCATWALGTVTSKRIVRDTAQLIGKLAVVVLYWSAAFDNHSWPFGAWVLRVAATLITVYVALGLFGVNVDRYLEALWYRTFDRVMVRIFGEPERMPEQDRERWAPCRNIAELAAVSAAYLEGKVGSQPAYQPGAGVDDETLPIVPALAAANRAGFYTTSSQPGMYDGFEQNAYVCGFAADYDTVSLLDNLAAEAGLHFRVRRAHSPWDLTNRGRLHWGVESPGNIESFYGEVCSDAAVEALLNAYQVVIEDPEAGRDDRVWPLLNEFTNRRTAAVEA
jgi:hypothetical protein